MRYDLLHVVPWYYMQEYRNDDIASYRSAVFMRFRQGRANQSQRLYRAVLLQGPEAAQSQGLYQAVLQQILSDLESHADASGGPYLLFLIVCSTLSSQC